MYSVYKFSIKLDLCLYGFILFLHKNLPHKKQHLMVMKLIFYPFTVISVVVLFN